MLINKKHIEYQLKYYQFQNIGKRKVQEDSLYINRDLGYSCICDGLGGEEHGNLASRLITESLHKILIDFRIQNSEDVRRLIQEAFQMSLSRVSDLKINSNLGTTIILLTRIENQFLIAHVGDSRAYYFSNGTLQWKTKDHSLVQELLDAGILTNKDDLNTHPMKNRITNAIMLNNPQKKFEIEINKINNVNPDDFFLLCSDGAIENYTDIEIQSLFTNNSITLKSRWELFSENAKFSSDNSSAILVQII